MGRGRLAASVDHHKEEDADKDHDNRDRITLFYDGVLSQHLLAMLTELHLRRGSDAYEPAERT